MSRGNPWTGVVLFLGGLGAVLAALLGAVPAVVPFWPSVAAGLTVALLGLVLLLRALAARPEEASVKPAHVAFLEKPRRSAPVPAPEPGADAAGFGSPAAPAAAPPLGALETEIREINRQIDRAKVMYGMGKLSRDGYVAYVRDLELKRGELEARRVRMQVGTA